jgi:chromosome segregation ATPase
MTSQQFEQLRRELTAVAMERPIRIGRDDEAVEARMSVLESQISEVKGTIIRLEGRIDGVDTRLRGVETSLGRVEGKIDALTETIVGQTSAALARLPSWWQMPAVIGATAALMIALLAGYRYLQARGLQ